MLARFDRGVQTVTAAAIILLMSAMTASILAGVFCRYILNDALIWSEEVARYAMIWGSFLGASLAFRRGGHIAVEFIVEQLPGPLHKAAILFGQLATLFFLVVLIWKGWDMTGRVSFQSSAALRIPMSWPYLALPVGGILMGYHLLVMMASQWLRRPGEGGGLDAPDGTVRQKGGFS